MRQFKMTAAKYIQIKKEIKDKMPVYLSELGIGDLNKNFSCIIGTHKDNKPSMHYYADTKTVKCFSCGFNGDIFDLYAVLKGNASVVNTDEQAIYDYKQVFHDLAAKYNIAIPNYERSAEDVFNSKVNQINSMFIERAKTNLDKTDYWVKRGISLELAKKFNLGFIKNWVNPKTALEGKKTIPTPRLIVPNSSNSYLARDVRPDAVGNTKVKAGSVHLFNGKALLQDKKPIVLVEGEFDALSIMEVSNEVEAVALGSTSNQDKLMKALKRLRDKNKDYDPIFFLAMDNDAAGELANHQLEKKLEHQQFTCYIITSTLVNAYKDANEILVKDRDKLEANIKKIIKDPDNYLTNLLKRIEERLNKKQYVPTGFKNLDYVLDGGLYSQLYVVGAVSSLGKTTFMLQIADNIARQGNPVFFFSLETSKDTLTEKNLSRLTFETSDGNIKLAQTARAIDNGYFLNNHPDVYKHLLNIIDEYDHYFQNLIINNGITNRPSAVDIYNVVKKYCIKHPDKRPVVIIDYLQILKPIKEGLTDKEAVTSSIAKLNEMTEEFHTPVILISSFNRQSYNLQVNMASFKESGEIEYYSDVLIGLQYQGEYDPDNDQNGELTHSRPIELVILKNRNGNSHTKVHFNFYTAFNDFIPDPSDNIADIKD